MDGPDVNLSFEKKLSTSLKTNNRTNFLDVGTWSLYPVYTTFRRGIKKLGFDVDKFFHDIYFFF